MAVSYLTKEKLQTILSRRLALESPKFLLEKRDGRILGHIISPTFVGKRDHQRQGMIWDALEAELGADAVRWVGMLLAYTPDEWNLGEDDKPVEKKRKKVG